MMQKEVTQCERTSIEGGRFGAHFGVLAKGRWLHDIDIYIYIFIYIVTNHPESHTLNKSANNQERCHN